MRRAFDRQDHVVRKTMFCRLLATPACCVSRCQTARVARVRCDMRSLACIAVCLSQSHPVDIRGSQLVQVKPTSLLPSLDPCRPFTRTLLVPRRRCPHSPWMMGAALRRERSADSSEDDAVAGRHRSVASVRARAAAAGNVAALAQLLAANGANTRVTEAALGGDGRASNRV